MAIRRFMIHIQFSCRTDILREGGTAFRKWPL